MHKALVSIPSTGKKKNLNENSFMKDHKIVYNVCIFPWLEYILKKLNVIFKKAF
jgi:hypothetical protein